jgi:hypothetical protein
MAEHLTSLKESAMIKMSHMAIALLTASSISVAYAQTPPAQTPPAPAAQGDASVDKNLIKNPDNKGLQNADKRVEANEAKAAAKRAEAKERHKRNRREEKQERMERDEKMERPAKPEHPGR